jgi:hypothetical protein
MLPQWLGQMPDWLLIGSSPGAPARSRSVYYAGEVPPKLNCGSKLTPFVIRATNGSRCRVVYREHRKSMG